MSSNVAVKQAADGVRAQVIWQIWSRLASVSVKAVAVRVAGPTNFAYTSIRLGLLSALSRPVSYGVRKIAVRGAVGDEAACALTYIGIISTCLLALIFGGLAAWMDKDNRGPIFAAVLAIFPHTFMERGRIFSLRKGRNSGLHRVRAFARLSGGVSAAAFAVLLPANYAGRYALSLADTVHGLVLWLACEYVADPSTIPVVGPRRAVEVLKSEHVTSACLSVWQTWFSHVIGKGEAFVLDLFIKNPDKGAYELVRNFATMVVRFLNDALEEQCFNLLSRLSSVFPISARGGGNEDENEKPFSEQEARTARSDCTLFLDVALKLSFLFSLFFAVVGPCFSFSIIHIIYGEGWSSKTPAPELLSAFLLLSVFKAVNGMLEGLLHVTGSAAKLKQYSFFSSLLSFLYLIILSYAAQKYSAIGFIAVICMDMTIRAIYSSRYCAKLTGRTSTDIFLSLIPHPALVLVLAVCRAVCRHSEIEVLTAISTKSTSITELFKWHFTLGIGSVLVYICSLAAFEKTIRNYIIRIFGLRLRHRS